MRIVTISLPDTLARRVRKAAIEDFESIESYIPILLDRVIPDRRRRRSGGKAAARKSFRPVTPKLKRARILDWFCTASEPTVTGAVRHFRMTRPAVLTTLTTLHREHGIGYRLDGRTDRVTMLMPRGTTP